MMTIPTEIYDAVEDRLGQVHAHAHGPRAARRRRARRARVARRARLARRPRARGGGGARGGRGEADHAQTAITKHHGLHEDAAGAVGLSYAFSGLHSKGIQARRLGPKGPLVLL